MMDLRHIKNRLARATEGVWALNDSLEGPDRISVPNHVIARVYRIPDTTFILNAKSDISALIEEVERLQTERIASWTSWAEQIEHDFGPYTLERMLQILSKFDMPEDIRPYIVAMPLYNPEELCDPPALTTERVLSDFHDNRLSSHNMGITPRE
ncbi:MAG: hypothetical protein LC687_00090 [Actinobacteria bacterium]|nr:hypothetical protein [Actinomycetota bacterium]